MIKRLISQLEDRYDADNDTMPGLPDVTWSDKELLNIIKWLLNDVIALQNKVADLEKQLSEVTKRLANEDSRGKYDHHRSI